MLQKIKTQILFPIKIFFSRNFAVCEMIWKNMVQPEGLQVTI